MIDPSVINNHYLYDNSLCNYHELKKTYFFESPKSNIQFLKSLLEKLQHFYKKFLSKYEQIRSLLKKYLKRNYFCAAKISKTTPSLRRLQTRTF